jgi:hypothetical protein
LLLFLFAGLVCVVFIRHGDGSVDCVLVLLQHGLFPIFSPRWMNSNATITANMLPANIACGSTWRKPRGEGRKKN